MRKPTLRMSLMIGAVALLALSTSGCGRRGRLLPPADPDNPFATEAPGAAEAGQKDDKGKAGVHRRPANPPIRPPDKPFILDPLL